VLRHLDIDPAEPEHLAGAIYVFSGAEIVEAWEAVVAWWARGCSTSRACRRCSGTAEGGPLASGGDVRYRDVAF